MSKLHSCSLEITYNLHIKKRERFSIGNILLVVYVEGCGITKIKISLNCLNIDYSLIGQFVGADLIHLEQVHLVGLIRCIELPHAVYLAS